jgi:TatD DNase family protein
MIDTHAHLYDEQFAKDRDDVIRRAVDCGIRKMLIPNVDSGTIQPLLNLCGAYPDRCFPMAGLHPTSVDESFEKQLEIIGGYLSEKKFIAIGEVGIDLYWDKRFVDRQIEAFRIQVKWAKQYRLPLVIHCRKSYDEILSVLRKEQDGTLTGIFHCFPGNVQQAEEVIGLGFKLGIGGVVTYKNAGMADVVKHINIDHILTETDAPYLPPEPFRGKRNESAHICKIVQKIAELKDMSFEKIAEATDKNAEKLFFEKKFNFF